MNKGRVPTVAAAVLLVVAAALVLWQFVFKRDSSMDFSTRDLPSNMTTKEPPRAISGVIPRRSPSGSPTDFTGGAPVGGPEQKGPPGRR
jgi:hypothetical protein